MAGILCVLTCGRRRLRPLRHRHHGVEVLPYQVAEDDQRGAEQVFRMVQRIIIRLHRRGSPGASRSRRPSACGFSSVGVPGRKCNRPWPAPLDSRVGFLVGWFPLCSVIPFPFITRQAEGRDPMWRDDPITVRSSRYCPRCERPLSMEATLCPECGETPRDQGFCGICQRHWLLPAGGGTAPSMTFRWRNRRSGSFRRLNPVSPPSGSRWLAIIKSSRPRPRASVWSRKAFPRFLRGNGWEATRSTREPLAV